MGVRAYVKDSVLEAINESPTFAASKELKKAVNRKVRLKGWKKNIGTVQIGQVARLLVEDRLVVARRRPGKDRIKEYRSKSRLRDYNSYTNV